MVTLCQQFEASADAAIFALMIQQEGQASVYGGGAATPPRTTVMVGLKSDDEGTGQFF